MEAEPQTTKITRVSDPAGVFQKMYSFATEVVARPIRIQLTNPLKLQKNLRNFKEKRNFA